MPSSSAIRWQLRVLDDAGAEVAIPLDAPKCVGRGDERVDIRLLSGQVSRRHAEFFIDAEGRLLVRDLKSTNGTEVNGQRIKGECALIHGDVVSVAHWTFSICDKTAEAAVNAQQTEAHVSSADSIAAMDSLLDSQGNLRHEQVAPARSRVSAAVPAKQAAAVAAAPTAPAASKSAAPKNVEVKRAETKAAAPTVRAQVGSAAAPAAARGEGADVVVVSGVNFTAVGDFVDSHAGSMLFGGSQCGVPALDDSASSPALRPGGVRASDLHLVGEGRAPGVSAADLCAVQAFADRQLVVPNAAKRRSLLCGFVTGPVFRKNLSAVVAVQDGKVEQLCAPLSSLPGVGLHIEKTLVRRAAQEKRAIVAWDAHFQGGASAVAVCCPLSGGEFLYSVTTFENATPAWMALLAQTSFMDRLIRKSWSAIGKVRSPAALPMGAAA